MPGSMSPCISIFIRKLGPWPQCGLFWLANAASNIEHASSFRAAAELFCWQCGGSLEKPPHLMALNRAHSCTFINSGGFRFLSSACRNRVSQFEYGEFCRRQAGLVPRGRHMMGCEFQASEDDAGTLTSRSQCF